MEHFEGFLTERRTWDPFWICQAYFLMTEDKEFILLIKLTYKANKDLPRGVNLFEKSNFVS